MKRNTEYVETMIKKSVINCIVIEVLLSAVILFTSFAPFLSDSILLTGIKAYIGYIMLLITMLILPMGNCQFFFAAHYPWKISIDTINGKLFALDDALDDGKINEDEKNIYVKKIKTMMDWFYNFYKFFCLFYNLELIIFVLIIGAIILKLFKIHSFIYSSFYGIITVLIIFQYIWFFITSRHLRSSYSAWWENKIGN